MTADTDITQLVDTVLHRQLGERVLVDGDFPLGGVVLVVVVLMGEDGVRHVALHVEVGKGILTIHGGILARGDGLVERVFLLIGFQSEVGNAVERRYLERELPAVVRLLHASGHLVAHQQLSLHQHLLLQSAVVDAQQVVGVLNAAELNRADNLVANISPRLIA